MRQVEEAEFIVRLLCCECERLLQETMRMSWEKIEKERNHLALTAPFVTGDCPNGCRPTFVDLNLNADMRIIDADTECPIHQSLFRFLTGHFYTDDHAKVCDCADVPADEVYRSENYQGIHGRCGRWMTKYEYRPAAIAGGE